PDSGTGSSGRSYRLTRGESGPAAHLIFNLACDPARQNYVTVKCWGNDTPAEMYLQNSGDRIERAGGSPVFPDRFYYYTLPIPLSQTRGETTVQLDIHVRESPHPLYAAFTHTAPCFEPDSEDVVGTAPRRTGYREPTTTLTRHQVLGTEDKPGFLFKKRKEIFGPGGTLEDRMRRQVLPDTMRTKTERVPPEVAGLDLFFSVSDWEGKGMSPDEWRDRISTTKTGFAYNSFPGELLNLLTFAYLLPPFTDANGRKMHGLDRHHDPELLRRIVAALDGASYFQGIDGGFSGTSPWIGVTSMPRATGQWAGKNGRQKSDWALLAGPSQSNLGLAIISLLNDPEASAAFQDYLKQSYDPDLGVTGADNTFTPSGRMLRAHAYERMLYNNLPYQNNIGGGTVVQRMFNILAAYSNYIALERLLELFPNPAFAPPTDEYTRAQKMLGLLPFSTHSIDGVDYQNFELSPGGLAEAHGALSCGFDGGGYGQFVTFFAPRIAQLSFWDPKATPEVRAAMAERARATINGFDQYLSPADRVTVENGKVKANEYSFCQETYITYRDAKNPNHASGSFNFDEHYVAADPNGQIHSPEALRSAYLAALYDLPPANFFYLADLPHYESTMLSLIGVKPSTLAPLPGEPGQPDYAWADTRAGAVAFLNHGERFYLTANYRSDPNKGPSQDAAIHFTTPTIDRACHFRLPHDAETVQPDGNLGGDTFNSPYVVRFGDYLVVLNNGTEPYPAKLPPGRGDIRELIARTSHEPGSVVPVPPGKTAIFWLAADAKGHAGVPPKILSVSASATTVTGNSVELQALASDPSGEDKLTYTWFLEGHPAQPVSFSQNGDNTAKHSSARFAAAGDYVIAVTARAPDGRKAYGSVKVGVLQTPKSLRIRPENPVLESGVRQTFFATVEDQFKRPLQRAMP
ncbi:MAG: immunoglobulin domain-containing protein, partial [Planctomycetota bacterium]